MLSDLLGKMGLDIPAAVIETVGKVVETIGEMTDSETIQSVGKALQESADTISS